MKKNNKGFSLVELIVVIAIMAVMIGIIGFSLSFLFGVEARQAAQKISAQLSETKTGAMSRYDESMTLSYKSKDVAAGILSDGYYVERLSWTIENTKALKKQNADGETRKVASPRVSIQLFFSNSTSTTIDATHNVTISYNRATGALDNAVIDGTEQKGIYISKMVLKSGVKEHTITFIPETGKHTIQ